MQEVERIQRWLDDVVIGLNLCPFAARPRRQKRIRIAVTQADNEDALLEELQQELLLIDKSSANEIETTLLVIPHLLPDFTDYTLFLDLANFQLQRSGWEGQYQLASFHPDYCFAGSDPDDTENLTNRSPYPLIHIIREEQLEQVLSKYPDPEVIPENNVARMLLLEDQEKRRLFPYLFGE
ncbi:DUF1415 domain-containing protein [Kistimonas scapharcae]|uniref:DUF1415 domain-containing protein n=1 Tax=Kistimonas scapharcae TaxID=1036133 RepID=A0ABP8V683_9GAMM